MIFSKSLFLLGAVILLLFSASQADIPKQINFQAVLKDTLGSSVPDGNYSMTFRIYDAAVGGTVFWQEGKLIPVTGGLFTTQLGSATPIPESVFADTSRWLGVQVGADPEIVPRTRLSAISYAYIAFFTLNADLLDGQNASDFASTGHGHVITSADIQNGTIVNADISNSANIAPAKISGTAWTSANDTSGSGLNADLLDGINSSNFLSAASDFGRTGVSANLYEGAATLTNKYVNATGPDSVVSTSGTGFLGKVSGSSAGPQLTGIVGSSENTSTGASVGGSFEAFGSGTGEKYGLTGFGFGGADGGSFGCYGGAQNTTGGSAFGGFFFTWEDGTGYHYGVYGDAIGESSPIYGFYGVGANTSNGDAYGGFFAATDTGTGTHYGIFALEPAGGSGAAVYSAGDMITAGSKNAVVKTAQGHRLLSVIESPEVWFEDFGQGQLVNGKAHVELDPLFLETVTINASNPMKVFVQLNDPDCNGAAVIRGTTGFDVLELQNGTSNASFTYRIVAKRKGYETQRLMQTDVGMDDPNLYPELWEKMKKEQQERRAEIEKNKIQE